MGGLCSQITPNVDFEPNSVTGLSENDQTLITDSWYKVNKRNAFRRNGQMFFIKLFLKYPSVQFYFPSFAEINHAELRKSLSLRAHGVAVFTILSTYIDCMDDPDTFIALVHKRTAQHFEYGVRVEHMEMLRDVFLEFMAERTHQNIATSQAIAAWDKFFTFHNEIFEAKCNELQLAKYAAQRGL